MEESLKLDLVIEGDFLDDRRDIVARNSYSGNHARIIDYPHGKKCSWIPISHTHIVKFKVNETLVCKRQVLKLLENTKVYISDLGSMKGFIKQDPEKAKYKRKI